MKFLLVGVLLLASVASLKAENEDEIEELTLDEVDLDMNKCDLVKNICLKKAGDDLKKKMRCYMIYRKCKGGRPRPTGPRPTRPPFVVKCRSDAAKCIKAAAGDIKKIFRCKLAFWKCIHDNRPTRGPRPSGKPTRKPKPAADEDARRPRPSGRPRPSRPPFFVKCRNDRVKCIKAAGNDKEKRKQCQKAFKKCIRDNRPTRGPRPSGRPTRGPKPSARRPVPPFVKCRIEMKKCKKAANGDRKKIFECLLAFPKCLYNSRPSGKPLPTLPPFIVKCANEAANCKKAAAGDKKKIFRCLLALRKCLRSNRPTRGPRP